MRLTTEHEREVNSGTQYAACFKGTDLRRTIIVIGCYCMQVLSGSTLRAYATYFFEQAGLPVDQAFNMSIITYGISLLGVIVSVSLARYSPSNRRLVDDSLIPMAPVTSYRSTHAIPLGTLAWGIGALLIISAFISNVTIGPVSYSLVSEISSSVLRSKSVVIARFSYACLNIAANVLAPYQLNPTAWNWGARAGFFWGGTCLLGLLFTYLMIPEPKSDNCRARLVV